MCCPAIEEMLESECSFVLPRGSVVGRVPVRGRQETQVCANKQEEQRASGRHMLNSRGCCEREEVQASALNLWREDVSRAFQDLKPEIPMGRQRPELPFCRYRL